MVDLLSEGSVVGRLESGRMVESIDHMSETTAKCPRRADHDSRSHGRPRVGVRWSPST